MDDERIDSITEFLGAEKPLQGSLIVKNDEPTIHSSEIEKNAESDYYQARESMKHMINAGTEVIETLAKVAEETESPRAFEVLATTLKTITEMNKTLMELHKDAKEIMRKDAAKNHAVTPQGDTIVFAGSTEDLQRYLVSKKNEQ